MTSQEDALATLARLLDEREIPYMVIGGHANALWGEPRATLDIDVTIWLAESGIGDLVRHLRPTFSPRVPVPESFVRETRVLPMQTPEGLGVDLIFGLLPYEEHAIQRAIPISVAGQDVRFCTPEDLILLKIVSTRERDRADIRGVVRRQATNLDLDYLDVRVEELARLLDRPEISTFWETDLKNFGSHSTK